MSVKLTDSRAIVSRGRGSAKVVALDVSFKELEAWARRVAVDERKLWVKSYGRACAALKKQFTKIMTSAGGVNGVPKFKNFESFTNELRTATNRTTPMGGVLADKRRIVAFKRNGWQIIGWPDKMEHLAERFQDGVGGPSENWLNNPAVRRFLHKKGIREIPRIYAHNERRVIPEPFGSHVQKNLEAWATVNFRKQLANLMVKTAQAVKGAV